MPLIKLKGKGQITLPAEIRRELGLEQGDLFEATVQDGKVVLVPQDVISREQAFADIKAIARSARERWEADGKTEDDIERLIEDAVREVRAERRAKQNG